MKPDMNRHRPACATSQPVWRFASQIELTYPRDAAAERFFRDRAAG
jgi:hypothetical protein